MQDTISSKNSIWLRKSTIFILYFIVINALNIQSILSNKMNVWKIFRYSFFNLYAHKDLYSLSSDYADLYLYSPSFAAMFSPFSLLSNYVGYFLWNNISMLLMPYLIYKIKGIDEKKKPIICYIALLEMATCLQGTQSNVMLAILMLLGFLSFENKNYWLAAFAIVIATYIKIYPIIATSLFLLYPHKLNFILKFMVAMMVIGLLPLLFIKPNELIVLYQHWFTTLAMDQGDNTGKISLTGLIESYFHISNMGKLIVQSIGVLLFCLMYVRYKLFNNYKYRLYFFCAILIWVTVFNHASEIYGYAIAIWGVGIWYALQKPSRALNFFMMAFVFFGTVLSIDSTPHIILDYIYAHGLKALPFGIMLAVIIVEMLIAEKFSKSIQ